MSDSLGKRKKKHPWRKSEYTALPPELGSLMDRAMDLESQAECLVEEVYESIKTIVVKDLRLSATVLPHLTVLVGYCTGPYGACVYNEMEDPANDDCLVCHQPRERK